MCSIVFHAKHFLNYWLVVHNEISNDYKPFKFQTEEGEQEVCEKMWKTLEKASGETFVNLMNQLEIQD